MRSRGLIAVVAACVLSATVQLSAADADVPPTPKPLLAGGANEYCVAAEATVRCWGWANAASDGSLGAPIGGISIDDGPITAVSARLGDGCILQRGVMRCWGIAVPGHSGSGVGKVDGINDVVAIASGGDSAAACGVERAGRVRCFGYNSYGQLGNGTAVPSEVPITVPGIDDATDVSIGSKHGCALRAGGVPWCWGSNRSGELGIGATDSQTHAPVRVPGVADAVSIAAGPTTCVITVEQTVRCWGYLGGAATVPNLSGVSQIAVGNGNQCALASGVVSCWGINSQGQLGRGTTGGVQNLPAPVVGLPGPAIAIAADHNSACALTAADGAWCWGGNTYRELGNNTMTGSNVPVRVKFSGQWPPVLSTISGPGPITSISTSGELACNATHAELTAPVFAVDVALPRCGLYVWGARGLAGPDTWGAQSSGQAWALVSHSETGDGSFASPRTSTMVARNATLQIVATVTNTYVDGDDRYRTTVRLANEQATPQSFQVVHAATCNLPHPVDPIATRTRSSCYSEGYAAAVSITPGSDRPVSLFTMGASDLRPALAARGVGNVQPRHGAPTIGARWAVDLPASGDQTMTYTTQIRAKLTDGVIATDGPFTEISTTPDLRCGRNPKVSTTPPFLANYSCGTWVAVGDQLSGPDPAQMKPEWPQAKPWIPVDQTEAGTGTASDPWTITTTVTNRSVTVEQSDSYVKDADKTKTSIRVTNDTESVKDVVVTTAGDCVHADPITGLPTSQGFGWRSAADILTGATGCSDLASLGKTLTWSPSGREPSFATNTPEAISRAISAQGPFDSKCLCGVRIDDAGGLSWPLTLGPGEQETVEYDLIVGKGETQQPTPPPSPPDDAPGSLPWNLRAIGVPSAMADHVTGKSQTIGVVDTGVDVWDPWLTNAAVPDWYERGTGAPDDTPVTDEFCRSEHLAHRFHVLGTCAQTTKDLWPVWINGRLLMTAYWQHINDTGDGAGSADPYGVDCTTLFEARLCESSPLIEHAFSDTVSPSWGRNLLDGDTIAQSFYEGTAVAAIAGGEFGRSVAPDVNIVAANVAAYHHTNRSPVVANPADMATALAKIRKDHPRTAAIQLMLPGVLYKADRTAYDGSCSGRHRALEREITRATNAGISIVIPAGDAGSKRRLPWPACLPAVISVGATNESGYVAGSSNSSNTLTLVAPGERVNGPLRTKAGVGVNYHDASYSTTKIAAAHVTAAIALYKQKYPNATVRQVKNALTRSAVRPADLATGLRRPLLQIGQLLDTRPLG